MARRQGLTDAEILLLRELISFLQEIRDFIQDRQHRRWLWKRLRIWASHIGFGAPAMIALIEIGRVIIALVASSGGGH